MGPEIAGRNRALKIRERSQTPTGYVTYLHPPGSYPPPTWEVAVSKHWVWTVVLLTAVAALACGGVPAAPNAPGRADRPSEAAPGPVTISLTGSMETARQRHTATVLMDGTVMVTGGQTATGGYFLGQPKVYDSAEIYDPAAGTWSTSGSMAERRHSHTATRLDDGRVLAVGMKGKKVGSEVFDPSAGSWSPVAEMAVARGEHAATLLQDGRVLVTGGRRATLQYLVSAETYDPTTDNWSPAGDMAEQRAYHTATVLADGRVLVVGSDVTIQLVSAAEVFDPVTDTWAPTGSLAEGRAYHTATLLEDGRVLVVGSKEKTSAETYDPATGTWSSAGDAADTRGEHVAALLKDGRVLVVGGGYDGGTGDFLARTSAETYDPVSGTWSAAGEMSIGRQRFTASLLEDGRVLVAGGQYGRAVFDSSELFVP